MRIETQLLTKNDCYKAGKKMKVKGIMVHSTGANNPKVCRYVPGNDIIGRNSGGNHWDKAGIKKCVHAFIGKFSDGEVGTVQTLPWDMAGWHAGGSANATHIGFEICEDALVNRDYFQATYREAVELCAMLCLRYKLDPLADGVIICHAEGARRGVASNHGDVLHWWPKLDVGMDDFRKAVKEEMTKQEFNALMDEWLEERGKLAASDWAKDKLGQAVQDGITDGSRPQSFATRQEVALMVAAMTK